MSVYLYLSLHSRMYLLYFGDLDTGVGHTERVSHLQMKIHSFSSFILVSSLCACVSVNGFLLPPGLLPSKKRGASPTSSVGAAGGDLGCHVGAPPTDIFIFGLGYTGLAVARAAKQEWGDGCRIAGTCRSQHKADALRKIGIEAFPFDIDGDYEPLKGRAFEILQRRYSICRPWTPMGVDV